jgi:aminocarboxymuconate-semialdehyde decarboxylase
MPVIDIHAHILPEGLLDNLTEAGLTAQPKLLAHSDEMIMLEFVDGKRFGPVPIGIVDIDRRLADMDRQGVDVQMLGAVPMVFGHGEAPEVGAKVAAITNDAMLEVAQMHPDRFEVFASLPMQDAQLAVAEIERMTEHTNVRGVQIGTHVAGGDLDDPDLDEIWGALEASDMPALLHPCPPIAAGNRLGKYHLGNFIGNPLDSTIAIASLVFGGVLQRHPNLRIGIVHGGGYWPYQTGRWDHGWGWRPEAQEHIKEVPSTYYSQIYCDTLTHDADSLRFLGGRVGWDHLMIGTDYPFDMSEQDPVTKVRDLGLEERDETAVLRNNTKAFLRPIGR